MKELKEALTYKEGIRAVIMMVVGILITFIFSEFFTTMAYKVRTIITIAGGMVSIIGCQQFMQILVTLQRRNAESEKEGK